MKRELVLRNKIREARNDRGLSQEALAKMCGVSRNTITSIERYEYFPTAYLAYIMCIALDMKFEELFYMDEK